MPTAAEAGPAPAVTRLRNDRAFVKLLAATTVSELGTAVSELALPLIALLALASGPLQVGALSSVEFLPYLLLSLPAGVWVDRLPRRRTMVVCDLTRTLLMASVPLAWWVGALTLAHLFAVAFAVAALTICFDLASQAWVAGTLPRAHLVSANSALQVAEQGSALAGPGIGGLLVGRFGGPVALVLDAVSYLGSAMLLIAVGDADASPAMASPAKRSMIDDAREGVVHVLRDPVLRAIAVASAVLSLTSRATYVVLLVHLVRDERFGPGMIGLLLSLGTTGFVAGAVAAPRVVVRAGIGRTMTTAALAIPLSLALLAITVGAVAAPLTVIGFAGYGFSAVLHTVSAVSVRQVSAPAALLGRVNATMRLLSWGTLPLAGLAGGALATWIGLRAAMALCAAVAITAVVPLLLAGVPRIRRLDDAASEGSAQLVEAHERDAGDDERTTRELESVKSLAEQQPREHDGGQDLGEPDERRQLRTEQAHRGDAGEIRDDGGDDRQPQNRDGPRHVCVQQDDVRASRVDR